MPHDLLIALNPEQDSSLPYLNRIPLGAAGIVLKTKDTWPRTSKLYCHRAAGWPAEPEIIDQLPVRRCTRRGAAIDLVLDRARENRSQFVITRARGREVIFWQSPKTTKQARPGVHIPTARAHGLVLQIVIDSGEKYPYRFSGQQAATAQQRAYGCLKIVFCETRRLAEEWTYRWLGACQYELELAAGTSTLEESFSRAMESYVAEPPTRPKPAAPSD